ncbi:MAG: LUD domain-containing protein [Sphingobacteriales bacterium]|nr:LUD domain-containing protein [Sphingobacteriales bacterium]MBI3720553.1 LUD domain-containing protein [Sphingobacteriales bacterium]
MKFSPAKENILKKIRQALSTSVPVPFPQSEGNNSVFQQSEEELEVKFAEEFSKLQGKFVYCANEKEAVQNLIALVEAKQWKEIYCRETLLKETISKNGFTNFSAQDLPAADAGITTCELLIARTGSIVLSSAQESGRTVSVYAPVHVCFAYSNQLVYDIKDGLQQLKEKYAGQIPSLITFATGPSRTADIEKTLVVGVHGPKEVFCFLIDK